MGDKKRKVSILKVAGNLFARFGFFKTTVNEIARAARTGKATLYYYFKGKEDIFREVIENERVYFEEKIEKAIESKERPQEKMKAYFLARIKYLNELENLSNALKNEILWVYEFIKKIREKDFLMEIERVRKIIAEGVKEGIFEVEEKDVDLTSFTVVAAMKGLEYPWPVKISPLGLEEKIEKILGILFKGILKKSEKKQTA